MYYVIAEADVGQPCIRAFGQTWTVHDFLGRVMQQDVGKRVYRVACNCGRGFLQVENAAQLAARQASEN